MADLVPLKERGTWEGVLGVVWAIGGSVVSYRYRILTCRSLGRRPAVGRRAYRIRELAVGFLHEHPCRCGRDRVGSVVHEDEVAEDVVQGEDATNGLVVRTILVRATPNAHRHRSGATFWSSVPRQPCKPSRQESAF